MGQPKRAGTKVNLILSLSLAALLTACGSGGAGDPEPDQQGPLADATTQTTGGSLPADPEFTPTLGIQINHESESLAESTDNSFIEAQWLHMQDCLQLSAQEPIVEVVSGKITPIDSNDDVLRHIDGQIQASAHVSDSAATIQIRSADFDGSLGEPGAYLRSMMGRYLWLSSGMPERDYPYECANTSA